MRNKIDLYDKISLKIMEINKFLKEDNGGIIINSLSDNNTLDISITGSCRHCKKNNNYLKTVIKEMIREASNYIDLKIICN